MTTDYPENFNHKPEGIGNIGRPLTRWEDDFQEEGRGQGSGCNSPLRVKLSQPIAEITSAYSQAELTDIQPDEKVMYSQ